MCNSGKPEVEINNIEVSFDETYMILVTDHLVDALKLAEIGSYIGDEHCTMEIDGNGEQTILKIALW